jgi:hypothetical protein
VIGRRALPGALLALFAGSLALYIATIAPGITWRNEGGDGGDFLTAAFRAGVPHPTGYPTYILGLRLFAWAVPIGDEAFRGNLFSAVTAALAVPFVFLAARALLGRLPEATSAGPRAPFIFATVGAIAFAVSSVFWSQATITEVYALNTLFTAALLWLALEVRARTDAGRPAAMPLSLAGLLFGLGMGNHVTLALVAGPFLVWVYWPALKAREWRKVPLVRPALALLLGLSVYIYVPVASAGQPVLSWGHPHTWEGFRWMITGSLYQNYAFSVEGQRLPQRIIKVFDFLVGQYGIAGVVLGVAGLATLWSRARGLALASASAAVVVAGYSVGYRPGDSYIYLIPPFLIFALWLAAGAASLAATVWQLARDGRPRWLQSRTTLIVPLVAAAALAAGPAYIVPAHFGDMNLRGDHEARDHARDALATAGQGGVILADGIQLFSLWYESYVAQPERDVLVVSTALLRFDWYWDDLHRQAPDRMPAAPPAGQLQRIIAVASFNEGLTPVFLTHDNKFYTPSFQLEPAGPLFRVISTDTVGGA